jgi:transposase
MGKWNSESRLVAPDPAKMSEADREKEIRRLRRELETVKQERDFLKKATAFFVKESH